MSGVYRGSPEMAHRLAAERSPLNWLSGPRRRGQQPPNIVVLPAGQIIRTQEILISQVIVPEVDVIGIDLPHCIAVSVEELVEIPQQKMGQDIHPAVLELHQTNPLLSERSLESVQRQMLGPLDIELQEVDLLDSFAGQEVVPPHHRTLDPLASPAVRVAGERGMGARARVIVEDYRTATLGQAKIERLDTLLGADSRPKLGSRCRHSLQGIDGRLRKQLRRHQRPTPHVGPHIEDSANRLVVKRRQQPALTVAGGLVAGIAEPFEVLAAELRRGLEDWISAGAGGRSHILTMATLQYQCQCKCSPRREFSSDASARSLRSETPGWSSREGVHPPAA